MRSKFWGLSHIGPLCRELKAFWRGANGDPSLLSLYTSSPSQLFNDAWSSASGYKVCKGKKYDEMRPSDEKLKELINSCFGEKVYNNGEGNEQ